VKVVVEQGIGEESPVKTLNRLLQESHPSVAIEFITDDRLPVNSTNHNVMNRIGVFNTQRSCHASTLAGQCWQSITNR